MSLALLIGLIAILALTTAWLAGRGREIEKMSRVVKERESARESGSHRARLQHPHVDLSRCLGCGRCRRSCPESGVLELIHGQSMVVHGARCVGHGLCAKECPTGAIAVTLGELENRKDIPAINELFESPDVPGLFLAGEVTGYALIRTAISHGSAVAAEVARRIERPATNKALKKEVDGQTVYDLCIVGAGPAGLSCSLEAHRRKLCYITLEQDELGGTVSKYPRRKLVMTQPVELPLHGRLAKTTYLKEELTELWERINRNHALSIHTSVCFEGIERTADGPLRVKTSTGGLLAHHVCLALGRRGTPRKLGVPGEELPKVAYRLLDAHSVRNSRVLVVGGGDSAVEAGLALADQPGNEVTLSYRRQAFFRLKALNDERLKAALAAGRLRVLFNSEVTQIEPKEVELKAVSHNKQELIRLINDEVFVLAGGVPPFPLLEQCGVSFDPSRRPKTRPLTQKGSGFAIALAVTLLLSLATFGWVHTFSDYYNLPLTARPASALHDFLRPSSGAGLAFGLAAAAMILANFAYLLRRSSRVPLEAGSLKGWMTSHVATGILALLLLFPHSAMAPRNTVGGHGFAAMAFLVLTGAIGRYFYSFVPRAANGRELALDEVKSHLAALWSQMDQKHRNFGDELNREIKSLVEVGRWRRSFLSRVWGLWRSQSRAHAGLAGLRKMARAENLSGDQTERLVELARRAHQSALMAARYEELRGLLASWRYFHKLVALLLVMLLVAHLATALRYGRILF